MGSAHTSWSVGSIRLTRISYFDIALDAESIDLGGVADAVEWAEPWLIDGQPGVGQAFWIIESEGKVVVVDPCGASDPFLRSGTDAVGHQVAAFEAFADGDLNPADVDQVVLTHLDGIGMAALADGGAAGEESWTAAFVNAEVLISQPEYDFIAAGPDGLMGAEAFAQLDALGVVRPVSTPHEVAPGVHLRLTGMHSPGHCCVDIESASERAVLLGHLAISPLHAARGVSANHMDSKGAWTVLADELISAAGDATLVAGSLWSSPGAAHVTAVDPFVLVPVIGDDENS